jgi:lipopolysaccharide biosynthesis protein
LTVRARGLNSAKSASGYSLAVLADYFVPPYFPLYPYYNPNRAFWPDFGGFFQKNQPYP